MLITKRDQQPSSDSCGACESTEMMLCQSLSPGRSVQQLQHHATTLDATPLGCWNRAGMLVGTVGLVGTVTTV